ncbi:MAG: PP2C family serine/threonine-protein phosphatase [Dermatophilaceae bacterium]|nr:protein phosphatase 2C domain-containing protein [Intrasporangiaceae bacterium]
MRRLIITAGAATDVGKVREHNEDALLVTDRVFAVADGMGGHAAGEIASAIAVASMAALAAREVIAPADVTEAVVAANDAILASAKEHPERRGMGTTLTGLVLVTSAGDEADEQGEEHPAPQWVVFNVGDSRVYRLAEGSFEQLTVDHSEVQELIDAGLITSREAAIHPARNVITRSLGLVSSAGPDVTTLAVADGERFLICSDGLSNEVREDDLARILDGEDDPQAAAERMCAAANERGGRDNITLVVVHVRGSSATPDQDEA